MDRKIESVIVVGGGSAGFLAAVTLKKRLPQLDVTVIHSSKLPIIGVGEGSTFTMPIYLHGYLGIDPGLFHRLVRPTYKLGIKFIWGPRERFHSTFSSQLNHQLKSLPKPNGYYCTDSFDYAEINAALMAFDKGFERQENGSPYVGTTVAYHLENEHFVQFMQRIADESGVTVKDDEVLEITTSGEGIDTLHLASGERAKADLFVDCSGFRSRLLGQALEEPFESYESSLFCDRAIFGGWSREDEPLKPYTTAETLNAGWSWQIEHDALINRGYVYSSAFISGAEAEQEFRRRNPKVTSTRSLEFVSGSRRRAWVKNVVAIGNASGFVEPLEATSLAVICENAAKLVQTLNDCAMRPNPTGIRYYNRASQAIWRSTRRFLALHYRFNTRLDTPFWRACREDTDLAGAEEVVEYYEACGPGLLWSGFALETGDPFGWDPYLVMLVGQKVPHRMDDYEPAEDESEAWKRYLEQLRHRAKSSMTMREGLDRIRADDWNWNPDFYANASNW